MDAKPSIAPPGSETVLQAQPVRAWISPAKIAWGAARLRAVCARLRRHDRGAAMVEFALASIPLLFIVFAITEMGLIFAGNVNLDNALLSVARQVRLGTILLPGIAATTSTSTTMDLADFKTAVCRNVILMTLPSCTAQLQIDVRVLSSFGSSPPNPVSGTTFSTSNFCFYSGNPGNTVSVRAFLLWPVATPVLLPMLSMITNISGPSGVVGGKFYLLSATEAFVNEPNSTASNNGSGC